MTENEQDMAIANKKNRRRRVNIEMEDGTIFQRPDNKDWEIDRAFSAIHPTCRNMARRSEEALTLLKKIDSPHAVYIRSLIEMNKYAALVLLEGHIPNEYKK